jgi:hypothetical protein
MKNLLQRSVFVVTITAMIFSFFVRHAVLDIIFLLSCIGYLGFGWYLFNPASGKKFDPIYFLVGYFISTALIGFLFISRDYPLDTLFIKVGTAELFVGLILLLAVHRNRKYWYEPEIKIALFLAVTALKIFF